MAINHCERFLSGKPYSLDDEGIDTMLDSIKDKKGEDVYIQAKENLVKEVDTKASIDDVTIYIVTCSLRP